MTAVADPSGAVSHPDQQGARPAQFSDAMTSCCATRRVWGLVRGGIHARDEGRGVKLIREQLGPKLGGQAVRQAGTPRWRLV